MTPPLRVALAGYGLAGRTFHAPLIGAVPGLEVGWILTRDPDRAAAAAADHPAARVVPTLDPVWAERPDLLVVATGGDSHATLAHAALDHGVAVVVDKPLTPTAAEGAALVRAARAAGVLLTVFQNRRWDSDQLTLRRLIADGALGEVRRYESRFERWRPELRPGAWRESASPEAGGGALLDLGSHLVDQALDLFGPVDGVYAEVAARRGAADDDCFLALRHRSGTVSHLWASAVAAAPGPRLRVLGSAGALTVPALDPQEAALRAGRRPGDGEAWGIPDAHEAGRLWHGEQSVPVIPEPGDWPAFYYGVRDALRSGGPPPVAPEDAVATLRILEAARASAATGETISLR